MDDGMSKQERVILITGIGRGIGRQTAIMAAEQGWKVAGFEINSHTLNAVAAEIEAAGRTILPLQGDMARENDCHAAVAQTLHCFGRIDVLVLNAVAVRQNQLMTEMSNEVWQENIAVNLNSAFYFTKPVLRQMMQQRSGSLIFLSSCDAYSGNPTKPQYAMVKGAYVSLSKSLAGYYGPYGIRSNCIAPGMTRTPLTQQRCDDPAIAKTYLDRTPLRRLGQPADIAQAILFLASDCSSWITGATIHVNGGMYIA